MVEKELKFSDGTRIFYEEKNGRVNRFIEYSYNQQIKEKIKKEPRLKMIFKNKTYNAGKYYYLVKLKSIANNLNKIQKQQLYSELRELHDKVSNIYDETILKNGFLETFGKYWEDNNIQCAAFFSIIYLAMLDLEEGREQYPKSLGKTMVLRSCKAVILDNKEPKEAAHMFERKHNNIPDEYWERNYEIGDSSYDKYNGYNGYDDDTIDIAFDGHPEATWNVD